MPEGITAGRGNTIYVGSLAGGGVWAGDVRTGQGRQLVPPWGGAATGVEYEARANRLWVAGGPTGTVRVYDAIERRPAAPVHVLAGRLPQRPRRDPRRGLRHRLVQRVARRHPARPARRASGRPADVTTLPLTGIAFEPGQFNANGIVAARGWLIVVDSFTGGLFRVDKTTGVATEISTGGVSVANGDGLELRGSTLYVVRNAEPARRGLPARSRA